MHLLVIGAAGATGRLVVTKALGHGHEVTAFDRRSQLGLEHERLTFVQGDARDSAAVSKVMPGHPAVAFVVGVSSGSAGIHEAGIANVIYAMTENNARRLCVLSSVGVFDRGNTRVPLVTRFAIATSLHATYDDLERMERRVMAADLDWAIVRPAGLSDQPATGHYRLSFDGSPLPQSKRVSRGDVASLVVKSLETETYWRRAVVIAG